MPALAGSYLCPREATRLLRLLVRTVMVAAIILVLALSLVHATQVTSRMVGSVISPVVTASLTNQSPVAERDLQDRVDQYLFELGSGQPAHNVGVQP